MAVRGLYEHEAFLHGMTRFLTSLAGRVDDASPTTMSADDCTRVRILLRDAEQPRSAFGVSRFPVSSWQTHVDAALSRDFAVYVCTCVRAFMEYLQILGLF